MRRNWDLAAMAVSVVATVGVWATPAEAHVTANPNEASPGSFAFVEFRIGHGCEESPTVEVVIRIPEEVVSVTPEVMDGWEIEVVREGPAPSADAEEAADGEDSGGHGSEEGRVTEVRWTGNLPSDRVDHFGLSMRFADEIDASAVMFPTVQRCTEGELAWLEVPLDGEDPPAFFGEADSPAPYMLISGEGGGHGAPVDEAVDDAQLEAQTARTPAGEADDSDTVAIVALVAAVIGLLLGAAALVRSGAARAADRT